LRVRLARLKARQRPESYTPTKVAREVARLIRPLVPELPKADGAVLALEPSAGIG
jgi:hypothetical protein